MCDHQNPLSFGALGAERSSETGAGARFQGRGHHPLWLAAQRNPHRRTVDDPFRHCLTLLPRPAPLKRALFSQHEKHCVVYLL